MDSIQRELGTRGQGVYVRLVLNGKEYEVETEPRATLLEVLRNKMNIKSVHRGCQEGECGACTVLLNGEPVCSCVVLAVQADGAEVTTVEGLLKDGELHPLMKSFLDNHGLQCGFCTPGLLMTVYYLVNQSTSLTEGEIRKGIEGNLCRCTGYVNIVKSVEAAMKEKASGNWW